MFILYKNPQITLLLSLSVSLFLSYITIPSIINIAREKGIYDNSIKNIDKSNKIPIIGGIPLFIGFIVSFLLFSNFVSYPESQYLILGLLIIFFIGLESDVLVLSVFKRIIWQIVASILIIDLGNIRISNLNGMFGIFEIPYHTSLYLTILFILLMTNIFNIFDKNDILLIEIGILILFSLGLWFHINYIYTWAIFCFSMVGSLFSFLGVIFFSGEKKIKLGKTGTMLVSFIIATSFVKFNELNRLPILFFKINSSIAISFALIIIPLTDNIRLLIIKLFNKKDKFNNDLKNLYHILIEYGFSKVKVNIIIVIINILLVILVFLYSNLISVTFLTLLVIITGIILNLIITRLLS